MLFSSSLINGCKAIFRSTFYHTAVTLTVDYAGWFPMTWDPLWRYRPSATMMMTKTDLAGSSTMPSHWRHNQRHGVSNHRQLECLFNHLFRLISKKASKPALLALCRGILRWTVDSPHKRISSGESVSMPSRQYAMMLHYNVFCAYLVTVACEWYDVVGGATWLWVLHFIRLIDTDTSQVLIYTVQEDKATHISFSIKFLSLIWWPSVPGHQQPRCFLCLTGEIWVFLNCWAT